MKLLSIIIVLFYGANLYAEACPTAIVNKGSVAPCTGYILSVEALEQAAKLPKHIELLEEKLQLKDNIISNRDVLIALYEKRSEQQVTAINSLIDKQLERDKIENLKLGLTIAGTAAAVALLAIGLAFAFGGASKVEKE